MALLSPTQLTLSLIALFLTRRVWWEFTAGAERRALKKKHGCLPPQASWSGDPLGFGWMLGNFKSYSQHRILDSWKQNLADHNAHTLAVKVLAKDIFITDDPENVKTILATDFKIWSLGQERIQQLTGYIGKGIFTNEGPAWKHSREMLRPCFERSMVSDVSRFEKHTQRLIQSIPKDGSTVDLDPLFHRLTLDISTEFLFGRSTDSLLNRDRADVENFMEAFEYCQNIFENENTKRWGFIGIFLPDSKFKQHAKVIEAFADRLIEEEISSKSSNLSEPSRYIFLDELMSATTDRTAIRSELLNILLAGRDTTACLLSNVLFELPRHPDIMARLRSEISDQISDEPPTYQQLKDLRYLHAIINESQRLWPIVPMNSRQALEDTVLPQGGGPDGKAPILIPKGAYVAYHSYSMHRREDIYGADANIFNPSRWLENEHPSAPLRPHWGYIPFSGGPRICIGQQFALTEAKYVIVRLLQTFKKLESRDPEPWREKLTIVCSGLGGCQLGAYMEPREASHSS